MKIVFTTSGSDLNAPLDSRFGRTPKFLVYDLDSETFEVVDNQQNLNAAQGAGIQSAEAVARLRAKALVTGHCGPKAFRVLLAAGIKSTTQTRTQWPRLLSITTRETNRGQIGGCRGHWA